ncbi:hypothetical protein OUZ56_023224 [Daphnia magna]|uniref:Uncharacterized protein n=1 Tax=Daphnia magna TaxID=35525 RepID=A0ABR0AYM6_9CRUS|nr:hypothetical protein OUZ56_023224 [Daphnia magna]
MKLARQLRKITYVVDRTDQQTPSMSLRVLPNQAIRKDFTSQQVTSHSDFGVMVPANVDILSHAIQKKDVPDINKIIKDEKIKEMRRRRRRKINSHFVSFKAGVTPQAA